MNIITIEEQTFKQVCSRFANFANQVERICRLNNHQSDKWLSGREVCALLGISWKIHSPLPPSVHFKVIPQIHSKVTP